MASLSPEEARDRLYEYERKQKKSLIIALAVALAFGITAFGMYAHHYIIWNAVETIGYVDSTSVNKFGKDPAHQIVNYTFMANGKQFHGVEMNYTFPAHFAGDSLYIAHSPSYPTKHNVLGLAYRDSVYYQKP